MSKKAFVIGANTQKLKYAESDAYLMRECLEIYGFDVIHPRAEVSAIRTLFDIWVDSWKQDDTVIFYFSGHGMGRQFNNNLQLIIGEKADSEQDRIGFAEIIEPFLYNTSQRGLIILDCCYSGGASAQISVKDSQKFRLFTAANHLEKAKELDNLGAGFLTFKFHEALTDKAAELMESDGVIRIGKIYGYIKKQSKLLIDKIPTPSLIGNAAHDLVIGDIRQIVIDKTQKALDLFHQNIAEVESPDLLGGWPHPVEISLKRLLESPKFQLEKFLNLFEAMVHFHFIVLSSSLYWSLTEGERRRPVEEMEPGISALVHSLKDQACCGASVWVKKCALTTWSICHAGLKKFCFKELVDIFEPETLDVDKKHKEESLMPPRSGHLQYTVKTGGKVWSVLSEVAGIRKHILPNLISADDISESMQIDLMKVVSWLMTLFSSYRSLALAMVSVTECSERDHVGIHCLWDKGYYKCVNNVICRDYILSIWRKSLPDTNITSPMAPEPPDESIDWNDSLLLYDPDSPYKKYVYLMPLGFRYYHWRGRTEKLDSIYPGLLDSVRWKEKPKKVYSILQRSYQNDLPTAGWQQRRRIESLEKETKDLHRCIETICNNYKFDIETTAQPPSSKIRPVLDLKHNEIAEGNIRGTVRRDLAIDQVLNRLMTDPERRLMVVGQSGCGKSVLLSQIFIQEQHRAVFISMDKAPLVRSEIHDLGMYCLDRLYFQLGMGPPPTEMAAGDIQEAMRTHLKQLESNAEDRRFFVVVDGMNLSQDPAGVLSFLPDPFPTNLFVLVGTQPHERVFKSLVLGGGRPWPSIEIDQIPFEEAKKITLNCWTQTQDNELPPSPEELPINLIERACRDSRGILLLLIDRIRYLRDQFLIDPIAFKTNAEELYETYRESQIPKFWEARFYEIKRNFYPQQLLSAILLCFYIISRFLTKKELYQAVKIIQSLGVYNDLPIVSQQDIENALMKYGFSSGFLRQNLNKDRENCWGLYHEVIGKLFAHDLKNWEKMPEIRLSLSQFGAIILPENASEDEFNKWYDWVVFGDENYESLYPLSKAEVCTSLVGHFSTESAEYWMALAHEAYVRLHITGQKNLGGKRQSELMAALEEKELPANVKAQVLLVLGDISMSLGEFDKSLYYFEDSEALRRKLKDTAPSQYHRREYANVLNRLGDVYHEMGEAEKSLKFYEESLEICRKIMRYNPKNSIFTRDVSICLTRLGDSYEKCKDLEHGLKYFEESLSLRRELMENISSPQTCRGVAVNLNRMGVCFLKMNRREEALSAFEKSLYLNRKVLEQDKTLQSRRDAAWALDYVGLLHLKMKQTEKCLRCFQESLDLKWENMVDALTIDNKLEYALALKRLRGVYIDMGQMETAYTYFQEYQDLGREIIDEAPTSEYSHKVKLALGLYVA